MTTPDQPPGDGHDPTIEQLALTADDRAILAGLDARARAEHPRGAHLERRSARSAGERLEAADERDVIATARDAAARSRDIVADAARRGGTDAEHGALAADDREAAALDREEAARERLHALVDRAVLADELASARVDPLTGARTRAAGLASLELELERCRRDDGRLVVAYVDVVGLKALNDTQGHRAGDDLLQCVVELIRARLRPYDLIIRIGGDEFLCAMPGATLRDVRGRFGAIAAALSVSSHAAGIRTGFAELASGESSTELIARADSQLIDGPHAEHLNRPTAAGALERVHDRLPAQARSVGRARRAVIAFARGNGASDRQCEDIAVAVSEAVSNAVVHAYPSVPEPGIVDVDAWMSGGLLEVAVCDEGTGMLPRSGRPGLGLGLLVILRMSRHVALTDGMPGVRLRMTFAIG